MQQEFRVKIARIVLQDGIWQWEKQPTIYVDAATRWQAAKLAAATIHHNNVVDLIPDCPGDEGTSYLFRCRSRCYVVRANDKKQVQTYIQHKLGRRYPLSWLRPITVGISKRRTPEPGSRTISAGIEMEPSWVCDHCDHINPQSTTTCQVCGCPILGSLSAQSNLADFFWECPRCHHEGNPGSFNEQGLLCWKCFGTFSGSQVIMLDQPVPVG